MTWEVASSPRTSRRAALVLPARAGLFLVWQGVFALAFAARGAADPWHESIRWWPVSAILANAVNLALLVGLARAEGRSLAALYGLDRRGWRQDARRFGRSLVAIVPAALVPNVAVAMLLWGDANAGMATLFQPLPGVAIVALFVLLPVSIALTELPTYFGYVLPRLDPRAGARGRTVIVVASMLALQHAVLPLVFDWRFAVWRAVMYLPLALVLGWALDRRSTLMPFYMTMHVVLDLSIPIYVVLATTGQI